MLGPLSGNTNYVQTSVQSAASAEAGFVKKQDDAPQNIARSRPGDQSGTPTSASREMNLVEAKQQHTGQASFKEAPPRGSLVNITA